MTGPEDKRLCPREWSPERIPANSSGTISSSSIATSHRTGRTNRSFCLRQYMFFGQCSEEISFGRDSERISAAERPVFFTLAERYSPFGVATRSSSETSIPALFANAGPLTCSVTSGCAAGIPAASTASRRGVSNPLIVPLAGSRSRVSKSLTRRTKSACAAAIMRAGISSAPISRRKSGITYALCRELHRRLRLLLFGFGFIRLLVYPSLGDSDCQSPHSRDHADAFGD